MVIMHRLDRRSAEDLEHALADPVPARISVAPGDRHDGEIVVGQRRPDLQERGWGIHRFARAFAMSIPTASRSEVQEAVRGVMAESAAAEMDADPQAILVVAEQIDVVI